MDVLNLINRLVTNRRESDNIDEQIQEIRKELDNSQLTEEKMEQLSHELLELSKRDKQLRKELRELGEEIAGE